MDLTTTPGYVPGFRIELNLRELGGLPSMDGRHVRHGLFFRGGGLAGLNAAERARLDELGLRFVFDLRAKSEAAGEPDILPEGAEYTRIGGMCDERGEEVDFSPEMIARYEREMPEILEDGSFMRRLYVSMAFGNRAMHELVDLVRTGTVPVYFHCTAGKDRTGVAALIIGLLLGIRRDAMIEDFLLTNEYRRSIIEGVAERLGPDAPPELVERWQKANGVNASDLEAVLDAIEGCCGTPEVYLEKEFGLDATMVALLRDRYLE